MSNSNLIRSLQNVERQFKPLVLNSSEIATATEELQHICSIYLNNALSLNAFIFSFHQLKSMVPWEYESLPSWMDYNYICPHFQKRYERAVHIDNYITRNNSGISFSYELLKLQEIFFNNKRIIVIVSFKEINCEDNTEVICEDDRDVITIHIYIHKSFNITKIEDIANNDLLSKLSSILTLNIHRSLSKIVEYEITSHYNANNLAYAIIASLPYISPLDSVIFILSDIVSDKRQTYGLGGMFVVIKNSVISTEVIDILSRIGDAMAIRFVQHYQLRLIQTESIKSAKAAIMSRNMSHNLGSHVMFYIKQKLQSVSKIVNNNVLHNIIPGNLEDINIKTITDKIAANKDVELPFLVGLGRFINYLQERQDYIATVATNYIPARSTISFKDFIYDELKPDLRYERHKRNDSSSDNGWQPKNLLLDYIAYSEGYSKSDAIEIKFGEFDGHNPLDDTAKGDFQALRKFNVAVPGGVIGRQAIFSIVENIIRNAAKHSEHRTDGKLVIEMSLVTAEDIMNWGEKGANMLRCQRTENSEESGSELAKLYADEKHMNKFHYLRIKVDMPNKSKDIDAVVKKLGESYIDEGGGMKDSSKGLKEMRISAAWLRGHSIDTGIPTEEPPVLAVYSEKYKETTDKETLSYILCIPKPCKVAFVVDKEHLTYVDANDKVASYMDLNPILEPLGCAVFGYDGETNELTKNEQSKESKYKISDIADYEIVCMLLDGTQESKKINSILPYISSRHITNGKTTKMILDKLRDVSDKKSTIDSIYEYWFNSWLGDKSLSENSRLLIIDDNAYEKHKEQRPDKDENASSTFDRVKCLAVGTAEEDDCKDAVIYSTHFAGLYNEYRGKKEGDNVKSGYEKLQLGTCIEPITGNNSTDRLIRQDEWTTEWKYKHLSAGLARVAVFDERIFGSFITSSKGNYTIIYKDFFDTIKKHIDTPMPEDDFVAVMQRIGLTEDDSYRIWEDMSDQNINETLGRYYEVEYNGQVAQKNYERRTWAFDIQTDKYSADTIDILGYAAMIGANPNWADENIKKPPIKVATLTADNGKYEVRLSKDGKNIFPDGNSQIFDYITIHQGILDKIYNAFGIKENTEENRKKKHEVTNALHRCFSRYNVIPKEATDFLPNLIIHSGRSKPNEQDMPQHQPFVQFAAVDHAVKDCKYTLVELLATAHYEKGGNNN